MEIVAAIIKYGFVIALGVEAVVIIRAIVRLAREKARPAALAPTAIGE
jgi:hypothetical protein